MNKKFTLLKAIVAIFVSLNFNSTQAQDTLNFYNPLYIKGCGEAGGGVVSIIAQRLHVNCPYCCQGVLEADVTKTAHRCNIPSNECGIAGPQFILGACPACLEIIEGMIPGDGGVIGHQVTVFSVGRRWWVTGLTSVLDPFGHSIVEGDIFGNPDGEPILP